MMAVCTYSLDKCSSDDITDVVNNHQFALTKLEGVGFDVSFNKEGTKNNFSTFTIVIN